MISINFFKQLLLFKKILNYTNHNKLILKLQKTILIITK